MVTGWDPATQPSLMIEGLAASGRNGLLDYEVLLMCRVLTSLFLHRQPQREVFIQAELMNLCLQEALLLPQSWASEQMS